MRKVRAGTLLVFVLGCEYPAAPARSAVETAAALPPGAGAAFEAEPLPCRLVIAHEPAQRPTRASRSGTAKDESHTVSSAGGVDLAHLLAQWIATRQPP